jgi:hypothetical protein
VWLGVAHGDPPAGLGSAQHLADAWGEGDADHHAAEFVWFCALWSDSWQ